MVHNQMYIDYLIKWNIYKRRDIQECWKARLKGDRIKWS